MKNGRTDILNTVDTVELLMLRKEAVMEGAASLVFEFWQGVL